MKRRDFRAGIHAGLVEEITPMGRNCYTHRTISSLRVGRLVEDVLGDFRAGLESDHRATAGAGLLDCGCQNSRYPVTLDIVALKSTRRRVEGVLFGVSIHCG